MLRLVVGSSWPDTDLSCISALSSSQLCSGFSKKKCPQKMQNKKIAKQKSHAQSRGKNAKKKLSFSLFFCPNKHFLFISIPFYWVTGLNVDPVSIYLSLPVCMYWHLLVHSQSTWVVPSLLQPCAKYLKIFDLPDRRANEVQSNCRKAVQMIKFVFKVISGPLQRCLPTTFIERKSAILFCFSL